MPQYNDKQHVLMDAMIGASVVLRSVTSARASVSCLFAMAGAAAGAERTLTKELAKARTEKKEVLMLTAVGSSEVDKRCYFGMCFGLCWNFRGG